MPAGLIVIDMLNPYEHEDAEPLKASVNRMLGELCELVSAAREEGMPVIYVNDNHGDWTAGPKEIAEHALDGAAPELVKPVLPPEDSPFITKARHSIFYETLLEYLLRREEIDRLLLAGQVTEQCILYSALDGYVRHFEVVVPTCAIAHLDQELAQAAIRMMQTNMHAKLADDPKAAIDACRG
jgi:nicotinamidase-related amidase